MSDASNAPAAASSSPVAVSGSSVTHARRGENADRVCGAHGQRSPRAVAIDRTVVGRSRTRPHHRDRGALALASVRPGQPSYRYASSLLTIPAIACWLATLHGQLLEAHTWSGAVVLLPIGFAARRQRLSSGALSSWLAYGPGIALMLLPSTAIAITQSGVTRPACLAAVAIATVVAGVRWRLQAPIELGAVTLTILALDAAWPLLSEEPKWLTAGIAGLVLLWLGATAERRLDGARDFLGRLLHLD